MILETERLILRHWEESDAEDLYRYASDPDVGPVAGWPPHRSAAESLEVIRNVLSRPECYAVCLKEDGRPVGAVELRLNGVTDMTDRDDECELGYWLGKPFWGRGLMPEAARELIRRGFEDLGMRRIWCGYYEGNAKSKRVQEKLGFRHQRTTENVDVPLMHEKRTGHVSSMTREEWDGMTADPAERKRCGWSFGTDARGASGKMIQYHDTRWCKPEHRDRELFAMLVLEGMQAGVSWALILNREEAFREAFDGFDPETVASYGEAKIAELMRNGGIIRNRSKIRAAVTNARAFLKVQEEFGTFDRYIWSFTDGEVVDHHLEDVRDMPAKDALSERVSADLKRRGFKFVGPVIVYSYLQGIGVINDHWEHCDYR